jgi:hypothetical protein
MFGLMDNNIGFHMSRQVVRPKQEHPDIITGGSLPEFVFTFLYSIASRSVLIPVRNFKTNLDIFINRWVDKIQSLFGYNIEQHINLDNGNFIGDFEKLNKLDSKSSVSVLLNNITYLSFNILVNTYNTLYTVLSNIIAFNINVSLYINSLYNVFNRLLSLNLFLGFNSFDFLVLNFKFITKYNFNTEYYNNSNNYVTYLSQN